MLDTKAKLVGLDLGRYKCKAITIDYTGKETVASFLTKRSFWTPRKTDMPLMKGSYVLEVNGEKYYIGKEATKSGTGLSTLDGEKKAVDDAVLYMLTAFYELGVEGEIWLSVCIPVDDFNRDKEAIKQILKGDYTYKVDGVLRHANVTRVIVTPEAMVSSLLLEDEEMEGMLTYILNIGSYKSNFACFDGDIDVFSDRSGSLPNVGWQRAELKGLSQEEKVKSIIDAASAKLTKQDWDKPYEDPELNKELQANVYLCGGVAEIIYPEFERVFFEMIPHLKAVKVLPEPQFSDARGCLQRAINEWSEELYG